MKEPNKRRIREAILELLKAEPRGLTVLELAYFFKLKYGTEQLGTILSGASLTSKRAKIHLWIPMKDDPKWGLARWQVL